MDEIDYIHTNIKIYPCPHCKLIGFLIMHGYLTGYDENNQSDIIKRGYRIFCSNRDNRKGCGKTFSIIKSCFIKGFTITANTVNLFISNIVNGFNISRSFYLTNIKISISSIYKLYNRFKLTQPQIRSILFADSKPPENNKTDNPVILTYLHIKQRFKDQDCPITAFQHHFQRSIF